MDLPEGEGRLRRHLSVAGDGYRDRAGVGGANRPRDAEGLAAFAFAEDSCAVTSTLTLTLLVGLTEPRSPAAALPAKRTR